VVRPVPQLLYGNAGQLAGWALLIGVFAAEVLVTRNPHGVVRAIAFFAIILLFFVVSRGKTTTQPPAL
jgi:hypothetical protein